NRLADWNPNTFAAAEENEKRSFVISNSQLPALLIFCSKKARSSPCHIASLKARGFSSKCGPPERCAGLTWVCSPQILKKSCLCSISAKAWLGYPHSKLNEYSSANSFHS